MKELLMKYKEIIMYLVFGVLTTVVNIVVYFLSAELLHINYLISNALAWFLSVLFAYITNRKYVFESNSQNIIKNALIQGTVILEKNILKEAVSFFSSRLATGILDMVLMWLFVYFNVVNDVIAKVIVNVIVVVLNYVLSKLVVFKGDK